MIQYFEDACRSVFAEKQGVSLEQVPRFQVQVISNENSKPLRELKSDLLNKIVNVEGIIVSATRVYLKARELVLKCSNCGSEKVVHMPTGMESVPESRVCNGARNGESMPAEKCPLDSYFVYQEKCRLVNQQML